MISHREIIQLIIAYTLTGALVFTVIATCLSLVGWIKFQSPRQQQKLFYVLIVQLCVLATGFFGGILKLDPIQVKNNIAAQGANQVLADIPKQDRERLETNVTSDAYLKDTAGDALRQFWKPDGTGIDVEHEAIIKAWMAQHGLTETPITMFIRGQVYQPLRSRMVTDLNLQ